MISDEGVELLRPFPRQPARPCIFEYIDFSRPDSMLGGLSIYEVRKAMGRQLGARVAGQGADAVAPDLRILGVPAALGFAEESGIPFEFGFIRNHYVGRTFIEPTQTIRWGEGETCNRAVVEGKRVVLVDELHRRGTTSRKIVEMVRGRREGGPLAHLQATHHPSGFLRHRHAGTEIAARRHSDA